MNRQSIMLRAAALTAAALLAAAAGAPAQSQFYQLSQASPTEAFPRLTAEQLDTLVGAIALYPDALVAQILPASTYPVDVVKAARLVRSGASNTQIDQQDWDPSVKAIAHYPSVIEMMDQSLDWTQQLGQAFITQPEDVMQAIQRGRQRAQSYGNLVSTPQQQVYVEEQVIRIVPANPEIIYVPVYDPTLVYYRPPVYGSYISFGFGFSCGNWFDLDIDWINFSCYRPGWTWNHWNDHFIVDRDRYIRPRHEFEPHRGDHPPTIWHRDDHRPITFPGRRMTHPSEFDNFRGRDRGADNRPTPTHVYTPGADRGRSRTTPNTPPVVTRPRDDRGQPGRSAQPSQPDRPTQQPRPTPSPRPQPAPSRPSGDTHIEPWQTVPRAPAPNPAPAKVAPPPVHIAPPPAAKPNPPAYVRPSPAPSPAPGRTGGGNDGKQGGGGNRGGGKGGDRDQGKH